MGVFALAADPRVFALRRVGNLGLWIFTKAVAVVAAKVNWWRTDT